MTNNHHGKRTITLNRVAITGLGCLSGVGLNLEESWSNLLACKSGIKNLSLPPEKNAVQIAGIASDFVINEELLAAKEQPRFDRFIHFALTTTAEALKHANLKQEDYSPFRKGVILGVGMGGFPFIEEAHEKFLDPKFRRLSPFFIPSFIPNMAAGKIAMQFNFRGTNFVTTSACASSSHAIHTAAQEIMLGKADCMITGGSEAVVSSFTLNGFNAMKALSRQNDEPSKASRPFDKDRSGFIMGEGAATLILENYELAQKRGAPILAELVGIGSSDDAYHITAPDPTGAGVIRCMNHALEDAGINATDIDYINAHGTSTPQGDVAETRAIKEVFGDHAYKLNVSSTKSMTGHLLGAAGALESAFCVQAIATQTAPPTANLENPDEECDLNYTALAPQKRVINYALNNSFGFGGTNSSLIFKKP